MFEINSKQNKEPKRAEASKVGHKNEVSSQSHSLAREPILKKTKNTIVLTEGLSLSFQ